MGTPATTLGALSLGARPCLCRGGQWPALLARRSPPHRRALCLPQHRSHDLRVAPAGRTLGRRRSPLRLARQRHGSHRSGALRRSRTVRARVPEHRAGAATLRRGAMEKKAALIIGAGDALGSAIARRFAREGFIACVARRNGEKLAPLVERIRSDGGEAMPYGVDARKEEAMAALVDRKSVV